jgi:hypothetical protein
MYDWHERVKAHKAMKQGRVQRLTAPQARFVANPNFDQLDTLLSAANQALTRALNASPAVTKPSDVKALVDAAAHGQAGRDDQSDSGRQVSRQEVATEIGHMLDEVEAARRHDVELMVEAAARLSSDDFLSAPSAHTARTRDVLVVRRSLESWPPASARSDF